MVARRARFRLNGIRVAAAAAVVLPFLGGGCAVPAKVEPAASARPAATVDAPAGPGATNAATPPTADAPAGAVPAIADPPATPDDIAIEALRRKSEAYAAALELMLREREAAAAGAAPARPATDPPAPAAVDAPAGGAAGATVAADSPPSPPRASAVRWVEPQGAPLDAAETADAGPADLESPADAEPAAKLPAADRAAEGTAGVASVEDSNTPLALVDVAEKEAVALVTPAAAAMSGPSSPVDDRGAVPPGALGTSVNAADGSAVVARLARRVRDNPRDVASHLEYQLMLFLMDEDAPNLATLATLPQEDRELVTALIDGIANLRATLRRDANLLIAEKIRPVVELSERLRTRAELTISTLTLCSRVDGFGRYEPMEPRFIAGRDSPTIVYCEIENFSSHVAEQQWQTDLSMEMSLFSEPGQQVYVEQPVLVNDASRSRRHDFFLRKLVKLPSNLPVGRYVLKVTIVDTQSSRVAEASLPLQVVAQ